MSRNYCFAVLFSLIGSSAFAQRDALIELYGEGVHRYFCSDYAGADQVLSTVVDGGSMDPRAHYFRGLAREAMGASGEMDFENGARLEAEGKRVVDVGSALTRIQGHTRTKIENARRDARIVASQQQLLMEQARRKADEADRRTSPAPSLPSDAAETDPFAGPVPPATPIQPATPVQPAAPAEATPLQPLAEADAANNPFGDDAAPTMPAAPTEVADPFGAPSAAPAADPFGAPSAAPAADPFGVPSAAPAADPFGVPSAAPAADPFGTPSDAPAADPFGTPATDNPFGI